MTGKDRLEQQEVSYEQHDEPAYESDETPYEDVESESDKTVEVLSDTLADDEEQKQTAIGSGIAENEEALREVIGAPQDTRVKLAEALVNPHLYYVDVATGEIYDVSYWERLHAAAA